METLQVNMELVQEKLFFCKDDTTTDIWRCKLLLINFSKLFSSCNDELSSVCEHNAKELLHAVAGVCSVSLPDMEISAIYSALTNTSCNTLVIVTSKQNVVSHRELVGCPKPIASQLHTKVNSGNCPEESEKTSASEDTEVNPFAGIISDEDEDDDDDEGEESVDSFAEDRQAFLEAAGNRRCQSDQLSVSAVGAEHCVLGCAAFSRLNGPDTAQIKPVQLSLLAVRRSCRKMGIGRRLVQCCKDPEVVGHYDVLLAYADPKAEDFFSRHGFSEDPILTARYQPIVDHWENSTLMVYTPPFSGAGLAVGSLKSLTHFQEYYKQWRESAIMGYSTQLGVMERLRHELLLLHSKVQTQEELIEAMGKELKQMKEEKTLLEHEFLQYRKHAQSLLCETASQRAKEWINTN